MSKPLPPSRVAEQFVVRFPDGMRDRIADAAKAAGRSMNAEIVHRLEQSFDRATLHTLGVMRPSKGRVSSMMDIYQREVAELRGAKQALADARAEYNRLMVEMLHGEDAPSRGTLRDAMAAENARIRDLEREIARLEDNLTYSAPQPTEEQIEAHLKMVDAMRAAEEEFKPTK